MSKVMKNYDTLDHLSVSDGCKFLCFLSLQRGSACVVVVISGLSGSGFQNFTYTCISGMNEETESRFFTRSWIDAMPFPVVKS
ncbi:hypothetical protein T4B_5941 [Trichinella pseudospiralis]|uniref:Uncharacterized protein n=1 Tax=Trichinella pseudospiralis TaxID=6337 RepID=A0A0V1IX80_TRIPS|nr:hypothetical protein T4B_5941 [Trichinella pseudospiralis]